MHVGSLTPRMNQTNQGHNRTLLSKTCLTSQQQAIQHLHASKLFFHDLYSHKRHMQDQCNLLEKKIQNHHILHARTAPPSSNTKNVFLLQFIFFFLFGFPSLSLCCYKFSFKLSFLSSWLYSDGALVRKNQLLCF